MLSTQRYRDWGLKIKLSSVICHGVAKKKPYCMECSIVYSIE